MLIHGQRSSHKTNIVIKYCMDAILEHDCKVVYCAGEGDYGVGKYRFPAHCREKGKDLEYLDDKVILVDVVPLLTNAKEVDDFIEVHRDFKPDIVVIDTLATAIAGGGSVKDDTIASLLCGSGTAGKIQRAFECLVMIPCHEGHFAKGRTSGAAQLEGNVYAVWGVEFNPETHGIIVTCNKMKDGPSDHSVLFTIEPQGVPVPKRICLRDPGETKANKSNGTKDQKKEPTRLADFVDAIEAKTSLGGHISTHQLCSYISDRQDKSLGTVQNSLTQFMEKLAPYKVALGKWAKPGAKSHDQHYTVFCHDHESTDLGTEPSLTETLTANS